MTTGIPGQKTLSLTAAVCMTELRRWSSNPASSSTIISSLLWPSSTAVYEEKCAGGGRWHAAVGTVGGNCFPGICQPRVTLAICLLAMLYTCYLATFCWCCLDSLNDYTSTHSIGLHKVCDHAIGAKQGSLEPDKLLGARQGS